MPSKPILSILPLALLLTTAILADDKTTEPILHVGGTGGAYFLAEPGQLVIDLEKRDTNRSGRRTDLRAVLVGPDRQVLQDITIPDDGQGRGKGLGPIQKARLTAQVKRKGVYGLNITVSNDRYGTEMVWGFRTNCPHYLIETARGHRDARREEPIVLEDRDRARDVCFLPRPGEFGIELTVPEDAKAPAVYDEQGNLITKLTVSDDGKATAKIPADPKRGNTPWRLHLDPGKAHVQIDGVTRWESGDSYPNLPLWSSELKSWFSLPDYRWLITPYRRTAYGKAGSEQTIEFRVHNNADEKRTIRLQLDFPGQPWKAQLANEKVTLGRKKSYQVAVHYTVPEESQSVHVRATPVETPEFSTYATLTVKPGKAPIDRPLDLPLTFTPYQHENELFGYLPDYPVDNQVYFDGKNRPYVVAGSSLRTWRDAAWATSRLECHPERGDTNMRGKRFSATSPKVGFDTDGGVYLLARSGRDAALLHSDDGGKTFAAYSVPGNERSSRAFDSEVLAGHNGSDGPPPFIRVTATAADPDRIWRRINDLELYVPKKEGDSIVIGEPIPLTKLCIGLAMHSGAPNCIVSRGPKVHVIWAEATDPEVKVPGVPTYVVTYDRKTKKLGKPALIGYGAPPNDIHNTPSITMDSQGYLHALAGTHGQPFQYAKSLQPNEAGAGWTEAVPTGGKWNQTYVGFVCDKDDTLHLVSRIWRRGEEPHAASYHARLAHQRKTPQGKWEDPQWLVVPPFSEYNVFYHRLTVDHLGRLFLSYDCWSTYWFYRTDHVGTRRALMMSADGGKHWKLAESEDLVP